MCDDVIDDCGWGCRSAYIRFVCETPEIYLKIKCFGSVEEKWFNFV